MTDTSSAAFFEAKYRAVDDPWNFSAEPYELSRYASIISALGGRRFHNAFEPGCSVGVLTERLAACCDAVLACDLSATAAQKAAQRCAALPNVSVRCASLDAIENFSPFDLIVLSEVGYYFTTEQLESFAGRLGSEISHGATLLAAHWLGFSADHRLSGDTVHEILHRTPGLLHEHEERHEDPIHGGFRIDLWRRA